MLRANMNAAAGVTLQSFARQMSQHLQLAHLQLLKNSCHNTAASQQHPPRIRCILSMPWWLPYAVSCMLKAPCLFVFAAGFGPLA
jgi:hypothetical protein